MKRKAILWTLLDLIFVVVFNIVFFVTGGADRNASVWISYGFIHFAYIMAVATPLITKKTKQAVLQISVYAVSSGYFILEFVIGLVFIILNQESYKPALIVQLIVAGLYLALLIIFLLVNEATEDNLEKGEKENDFIKTCSSRVKLLMGRLGERGCDKALENLYDLIHSSPSHSSASVSQLEQQAMGLLSQLEGAVNAKEKENAVNIANQISEIFKQRNQILKKENQ